MDRLKLCTHRSQYNPNQPMAEMAKILEQLRKSFHSMLDKMYSKELRVSFKIVSFGITYTTYFIFLKINTSFQNPNNYFLPAFGQRN